MANPALAKFMLETLLEEGHVDRSDRVVAVCAGSFDRLLFDVLRFEDVTLTNLDVETGTFRSGYKRVRGIDWVRADAHDLPFEDDSFDIAWVSDGLHHCQVPHQAVAEMFRVAKRATVVVESRDSLAMRAATHARIVPDYEVNSRLLETREHGGVNFGPVPNFIYRWTERDFEKAVLTSAPHRRVAFDYFHALRLPPRVGPWVRRAASSVFRLAPRQGNGLGMVARPQGRQAWVTEDDQGLRLSASVTAQEDVATPQREVNRHVLRETARWYGWPKEYRVADVNDHA